MELIFHLDMNLVFTHTIYAQFLPYSMKEVSHFVCTTGNKSVDNNHQDLETYLFLS